MSFSDYIGTPFQEWILPIIPAGAPLAEWSKLTPDKLGKIPGQFWPERGGVWSGFKDWTKWRAEDRALRAFDTWYKSYTPTLGINSSRLPGIDIDFENDPELVEQIVGLAALMFPGPQCVRTRPNSSRVLLAYRFDPGLDGHGQDLRKQRFPFLDFGQQVQAVELLGHGQQWLMEGRHPSGVNYAWRDGQSPLKIGWDNIPHVTWDGLQEFFKGVRELIEAAGYEPTGANARGCKHPLSKPAPSPLRFPSNASDMRMSSAHSGEDHAIGPDHPDLCPNLDILKDVLQSYLPVTDPLLDYYDDFLNALIAVKTACGGDEEFWDEVVVDWLAGNPENDIDVMRAKWDGLERTRIGWGFLCGLAAERGYYGHAHAPFEELDEPDAQPLLPSPEPPKDRGLRGPKPKLIPADFALHKLPRRAFVLGRRFMAGTVTLGVGAPGAGKSNLAILTALSIATGRALTGEEVHRTGRVWIHNNEDSIDELYRRIGGMLHHAQIDFVSVRDNIYVNSGLDERLVVAIKHKDLVERTAAVADVIAAITEAGIVHMVIDPFVSTHRGVSENSNDEIEQVAEAVRHIAHETGCSIDLIHHSLKPQSRNTEKFAGDMNGARGASALIGAVRMVYTLSTMSKETARDLHVAPDLAARLVRLDHGKGNYTARDPAVRWWELVPFDIGNAEGAGDEPLIGGDTIAVPVPWLPHSIGDAVPRTDEHEHRLQQVRDCVVAAMQSNRCRLDEVLPSIQHAFEVKESAARKLVMDAITEDDDVWAKANGCHYRLTLERKEPCPPKPLFVVRTLRDGLAEAA